mmetsp:Transcript_114750/g.325030  ORF Transcript_114750/g.325030 Transcript_114750/m.325030 type:complete len:136 (+) Transcript_114750:115-522(+)|eukprot:CAMPEP_0179234786 /NCGR_PEP_ID=MMETSP0797-20121207/13070_1 /TAXON_ID=47934 /ORGANISM="Dinophysis acuminata, Strain DAEP01" /LENGTH=135 /DNA_ID=CAMNT_0020941979 /DNA_START=118 /DNA_END=525 /DNA_ORIENTATION=+
MAAAVGAVAIKVGGDLAAEAASAGSSNIFNFIEVHFGRGEAVTLDMDIVGYNRIIYGNDNPELRALGTEYLEVVKDNGWIYTYRFYICNNKSLKIWITDYEPDTYLCTCYRLGKHYVDFNSRSPGIKSIMVQSLG